MFSPINQCGDSSMDELVKRTKVREVLARLRNQGQPEGEVKDMFSGVEDSVLQPKQEKGTQLQVAGEPSGVEKQLIAFRRGVRPKKS